MFHRREIFAARQRERAALAFDAALRLDRLRSELAGIAVLAPLLARRKRLRGLCVGLRRLVGLASAQGKLGAHPPGEPARVLLRKLRGEIVLAAAIRERGDAIGAGDLVDARARYR